MRDTLCAVEAPAHRTPLNSISRVRVTRVPGGEDGDVVAVEEPLEIRIGGVPVAVTMRTPGHDEELALGFCLSEGLRPLGARVPDDLAANAIDVDAPGADVGAAAAELLHLVLVRRLREGRARGGRGRGGSRSRATADASRRARRVASGATARRAGGVRGDRAGCTPPASSRAKASCSACARTSAGHNALDKVVGRAFLDGRLPLSAGILCVSGRLSFELVQKAAVAGCPLLVAVGAPSSLAVELAADRGITLCGFVRGGSLNVYTEPWRIER